MAELRKLLTVDAFASELNIKPSTVRRWLLLRKVLAVKIGRAVRIPQSEVDRIVTEGTRPARPEGR